MLSVASRSVKQTHQIMVFSDKYETRGKKFKSVIARKLYWLLKAVLASDWGIVVIHRIIVKPVLWDRL